MLNRRKAVSQCARWPCVLLALKYYTELLDCARAAFKILTSGRSKWQKKPSIKFQLIPQRTRLAKLSKTLVTIVIKGVIKNAAGFILIELVECLAVF